MGPVDRKQTEFRQRLGPQFKYIGESPLQADPQLHGTMNKVTANTDHLEIIKADLGGAGDYGALSAEAQLHQDAEHTMGLKEALRRYPKAIMWSVILSGAM